MDLMANNIATANQSIIPSSKTTKHTIGAALIEGLAFIAFFNSSTRPSLAALSKRSE